MIFFVKFIMQDITNRFLKFCEYLILQNIVKNSALFAKEVGISNSLMTELSKGRSNVGTKAIHNSVLKYHLNTDWLYTGEGNMLKSDIAAVAPVSASAAPAQESSPTTGGDVIHVYNGMLKEKDAEIARLNRENGALQLEVKQKDAEIDSLN